MVLPLVVVSISLALLGFGLVAVSVLAIRRKRPLGTATSLALALLALSLAGLCGTIAVAAQGYRALTREEVVAVVDTEPAGPQRFTAAFRFSDGREDRFSLAGDALYVDAHIVKWKPFANLLGLHTAYQLDRVAGRYAQLADERMRPRTIFSLTPPTPMDIVDLRRRFPFLRPLVDAEYGSATFVLTHARERFEVRVSTTGLLVRRIEVAAN